MQFHRLAALILGIWLGAGVFMDLVASQNFRAVGRMLSSLDVHVVETVKKVGGPDSVRLLLRTYAGETNGYLFEQWEWAELMIGLALLLVLLFARTYQKFAMAICLLMMCIVAAQRFELTPKILKLGREQEFNAEASRSFAVYHATYAYSELAKLLLGLVMAARLLIRRGSDRNAFAREYAKRA
jgi:hypothetical protein